MRGAPTRCWLESIARILPSIADYDEAGPVDGEVEAGSFEHFQGGSAEGFGGASHVLGALVHGQQVAVKVDH